MPELPDWTLVRSFLAVIRGGSLSAAARASGSTQPTVGRHVEQFERSLGVALFTRSPGGLIPTEAARSLLVHAEAMEASMAALIRAAGAGGDVASPRGTVRISASEMMGLAVLPAILRPLRFEHPAVTIELVLNNRTDDLLRRTVDIAVRMVRPAQGGLVALRIGGVPLGLYAHRDYVERFGQPGRLEDLVKFHLVGFDRDDHSARAVALGTLPITRDIFAFRSDHDAAQFAAIEAGLGIGVVQTAIARRYEALLPILPEAVRLALDCWLAVHEDLRDQPAVRVTLDALASGLKTWVSGVEAV